MRYLLLVFVAILTATSTLDAREPAKESLADIYVPLSIKYSGGDYKNETFNYRLMRPRNAQAGKRYPLIVFLHGAGERGTENERQLFYLPEQMAKPEFRKKFPCYLLAPQCRSGKQWVNVPWVDKKSTPMAKSASHQLQAVIAMVEQTLKNESIDPDRVYLTGLSMGGYGSWELAARHPNWFAAVAPICGGGDELQATRLAKLPLWAFHGDADGVVPVGRSRRMISALKKSGGKPKYTELPGVGHNAWTPAYQQEEGVVAWMFQQTRKKTAGQKLSQTKVKRRVPWTTSRLHGTPTPPPPYRIQTAFPGVKFTLPTSLQELPGMNRLMVTEIGGTIYSFAKNKDVKQADRMLELNDEAAIFHATVHPSFEENKFIFVCYKRGENTFVSRFKLAKSPAPKLNPKSEHVVMTWPSGGHNGGCIRFGKDGYLYISTGDGSGPNPPDGRTAGQDVSNLFGAVLRIDVDRKSGDRNYSVPADNPFVDLAGARPEIWAYGLRNPWKFGVDSKTGNIFVADNGWESWEMVHQIVRGSNCGWPIMEARAVLRSEVKRGPTPIRPPVVDHPHSEANSVIGGPVYRGKKLPELDGSFIYGDYITGTIWGLKSEDGGSSYSSSTLVDTDQRITAFAEGSRGELFVLDYDYTGQIYELLPSGLADTSAEFPRRLSQTGLFVAGDDGRFSPRGELKPAAGVVGYDVIAKRWMDGAEADRYVAIPNVGKILLASDNSKRASYPDGTVFVKHLSLPSSNRSSRLETQVLHFEHDRWNAYAYLWNAAGTDAELVAPDGADLPLQIKNQSGTITEHTWHTSTVNECRLCHNAGSGFVLGFVPNQLRMNANSGIIAGASTIGEDDPSRLIDPHDATQSLNDRARSYLHANCSMCHHPGGNAIVSFYLRRELPFHELRTNKSTGIGTFGMRNAKLIVPGDPYRSVLMYRMSKLGYSRMPYIGSRVIDSAGVKLIHDWIRAMPRTATSDDSAPIRPNTAEAEALSLLAKATSTQQQRNAAIQKLTESSEGSLALVMPIHAARKGNGPPIRNADQTTVQQGYQSSRTDIRGLFETFIPEAKRRATLGPNIKPETILSLSGKVDRGKLIFFSDGARCRICHDVNDANKSTGPTLGEIAKKYPRRSELLQHVLQPSLKVDDKFATYVVVTTKGRVLTGLLAKQTESEVTLRVPNDTRLVSIKRAEIDEMFKDKKSLMPERILMDLTAQEAADLLQYLQSVPPAK
ncbi:MAG: hypothetical protein HOL01_11515 [Planctomycetaceae bacterium]|jgi:putative heme-binding domain-containing protein|nr:hypothetical protein [Planctomycetaceae bacterium]MBT6487815.1 hypothetical protein [Planctomycetaceae bacterium]MBT6495166.1 hypothetical protein [Planctomycetaceae bacterium]